MARIRIHISLIPFQHYNSQSQYLWSGIGWAVILCYSGDSYMGLLVTSLEMPGDIQ